MLTDKDREALENVLENGRVDDVLLVILATKCATATPVRAMKLMSCPPGRQ